MRQTEAAVTKLLQRVHAGDEAAQAELINALYGELSRLAKSYMNRERRNHTLQPTALVNEAFIRLLGNNTPEWQNRSHFIAHAARAMRQVLVDHARNKKALKRGGEQVDLSLDSLILNGSDPPHASNTRRALSAEELITLDDALSEFASAYPRQAEIVQAFFFAGAPSDEIARAFRLTDRSVRRDLAFARLWLLRHMSRRV